MEKSCDRNYSWGMWWGDGSVSEVLVLAAWGPESNPPEPVWKSSLWWPVPETQSWEGWDCIMVIIPGRSHWSPLWAPDSMILPQKLRWREREQLGKMLNSDLWPPSPYTFWLHIDKIQIFQETLPRVSPPKSSDSFPHIIEQVLEVAETQSLASSLVFAPSFLSTAEQV